MRVAFFVRDLCRIELLYGFAFVIDRFARSTPKMFRKIWGTLKIFETNLK